MISVNVRGNVRYITKTISVDMIEEIRNHPNIDDFLYDVKELKERHFSECGFDDVFLYNSKDTSMLVLSSTKEESTEQQDTKKQSKKDVESFENTNFAI